MKLVCRLCDDRLLVDHRDVLMAHVAGHRLVGDDVQVHWVCADSLLAAPAKLR